MRADESQPLLSEWDPESLLVQASPQTVKLSRGFLCCRPQKWFPSFAMQWLPLCHSLGIECKVLSVRPLINILKSSYQGFAATIDDEPMGVLFDDEARTALLSALCPGASPAAEDVLLEYFARRFLSSLATSWSGPESSPILFDASIDPLSFKEYAALQMNLALNGSPCSIMISVGPMVVERLDKLWKKQIRSTTKQNLSITKIALEVAQLAVPPSLLSDYLKSQAVVDLEVPVSDRLMLKVKEKGWAIGRLIDVSGKFGFEVLDDVVPNPRLPEGTTRISIQFGALEIDPSLSAELSQPGAMMQTNLRVGRDVHLIINGEKVADAELMTYEGRFAIRIK